MEDKQIKKKYEKEFSQKPEKYYPVQTLKILGHQRKKCSSCGRFFWAIGERKVCGEASCCGEYSFLVKKIARKEYSYVEMWRAFSKILQKHGYQEIRRYPVSARWRDDIHFVEASIDDFIPYVISGEVDPPANPLIVPQLCLRFNDIENIGITGSHFSLFTMIGQHKFTSSREYSPNDYLLHLLEWYFKGLKMKKEDIVFHEDVWAGSGNFGPCIELFSGGLELCNQVYMQFRHTGGSKASYRDLKLKVLDMGLGQERNTWFSQGTPNAYEAVFPSICKEIRRKIGLKKEDEILKKFVPYAGMLNIDEVDSVEQQWELVSKKIGVKKDRLREHVLPLSQMYSIIEHARVLLVAINDGVLPSNVSGGHNLRVVLRRALDFIKRNEWDIDFKNIVEKHAGEMSKIHPELNERVNEINEIVEFEEKKYEKTRKKIGGILEKIGKVDVEKAIELYESQGISPELLKEKEFKIPENFYSLLTEKHRKKTDRKETISFVVRDTELLYRKNEYLKEFEGKIVKVVKEGKNKWIVLDKTAFYPTSGGQIHDTGRIVVDGKEFEVNEVKKIGNVVLHKIKGELNEGSIVKGEIDWERRYKNMKHHTATHVLNGACQKVLGRHIWQAGAEKTPEKGRLDITHYKNLERDEINEIEKVANEFIEKDVKLKKRVMKRKDAEREYGFRLYQGGAIPGNDLRVVEIPEFDVEACGGTHVDSVGEVGKVKIISTKKIQDGVVRLEFVAGDVLKDHLGRDNEIKKNIRRMFDLKDISLQGLCEIYSVKKEELVKTLERFLKEFEEQNREIKKFGGKKRVNVKNPEELFSVWKEQRKEIEKLKKEYQSKLLKELEKKDTIEVETSSIGFLMELFNQSGKKKLILGEKCGIGPLNRKKELEKRFRKIVEKGEMVMGFGRK